MGHRTVAERPGYPAKTNPSCLVDDKMAAECYPPVSKKTLDYVADSEAQNTANLP